MCVIFAVAVKLVAEDVVDDQTFDRQVFTRFAEGRLVAFDERVRVRAFAGQGGVLREYRDDAGQQVRARLVGEIFESASANACSIMREVVVLPFVPVTTVTFTPRDSSPRIIFINFQCQACPAGLVPPRPSLRRTAPDALHTSTASLVWSFIAVTSFFKSYKISIAHLRHLHKGKRWKS